MPHELVPDGTDALSNELHGLLADLGVLALDSRLEDEQPERRPDHLALPASRSLDTEGDDRHLRALGTCQAKAPSRQDGGRLPSVTQDL